MKISLKYQPIKTKIRNSPWHMNWTGSLRIFGFHILFSAYNGQCVLQGSMTSMQCMTFGYLRQLMLPSVRFHFKQSCTNPSQGSTKGSSVISKLSQWLQNVLLCAAMSILSNKLSNWEEKEIKTQSSTGYESMFNDYIPLKHIPLCLSPSVRFTRQCYTVLRCATTIIHVFWQQSTGRRD